MDGRRKIAVTIPLAALLLAAAPASPAAADVCEIAIEDIDGNPGDEVKALDLNETRGSGDEIFFEIGGRRFPTVGTVQFPSVGTIRSAGNFGFPEVQYNEAGVNFRLIEDDTVINDVIFSRLFACTSGEATLRLIGRNATYDVELAFRRF